ncbi:hypothetical protein J4760_11675 [Salinicoccus sp. ID82-1]|uniref:hypothetical protein n=1 Tax=Salinicoccus TaxID=45669 RepID=UPI00164382ED|nr:MULTISPECIES: hypothetical protein [Salinicoccus]MCG1010678.1 hypothetical protein [Salinicoccus sp. ID82-1]
MTRFLLNLVLMGIIALAIYWLIMTFAPALAGYAIPLSLLLGITLGFFIYITIDNRIG